MLAGATFLSRGWCDLLPRTEVVARVEYIRGYMSGRLGVRARATMSTLMFFRGVVVFDLEVILLFPPEVVRSFNTESQSYNLYIHDEVDAKYSINTAFRSIIVVFVDLSQ